MGVAGAQHAQAHRCSARFALGAHLHGALVITDFVATSDSTTTEILDFSDLLKDIGYTSSSSLSDYLSVQYSGANNVNTEFRIDLDGSGSGTALQTITLQGTHLSTLDLTTLKNNGVLVV